MRAVRRTARLDQVFWPIFYTPFAHTHKLHQLGHVYKNIFESPFLTAPRKERTVPGSHLHSADREQGQEERLGIRVFTSASVEPGGTLLYIVCRAGKAA